MRRDAFDAWARTTTDEKVIDVAIRLAYSRGAADERGATLADIGELGMACVDDNDLDAAGSLDTIAERIRARGSKK